MEENKKDQISAFVQTDSIIIQFKLCCDDGRKYEWYFNAENAKDCKFETFFNLLCQIIQKEFNILQSDLFINVGLSYIFEKKMSQSPLPPDSFDKDDKKENILNIESTPSTKSTTSFVAQPIDDEGDLKDLFNEWIEEGNQPVNLKFEVMQQVGSCFCLFILLRLLVFVLFLLFLSFLSFSVCTVLLLLLFFFVCRREK